MRGDGVDPPMPDLDAPWIIDWLMEAGPVEATGMERIPLSWREIDAWCVRTHTTLAPWEARLLRRLSTEYLGQHRLAEKPDCPPPWQTEMTEDARDLVDRKLDAMFAAFD